MTTLDVKLTTDPAATYEEKKKELLTKLNNLVMASLGVYSESTDRAEYAKNIRGIINNAAELGIEFQRTTHAPDQKVAERPHHEAPPHEDKKAAAKAAVAKL